MCRRRLIGIGGVALALLLCASGNCHAQTMPSPLDAYHANTIVANPFPDDPELAPTLVSLNLHHADLPAAMKALAEAAHCTCTVPKPTADAYPGRPIDLVVDRVPLLDAMLQMEAQAGVAIYVNNRTNLRAFYGRDKTLPGAWCVSGSFAFVVTKITRAFPLGTDGQAYVPTPNLIPDPVDVDVDMLVEPKLTTRQMPAHLDCIRVDDDRGNSLIPQNMNYTQSHIRVQGSYEFGFTYQLSYPAINPGKSIKRLSATSHFILQLQSTHVNVDNPTVAATTKDLDTVKVTFGQPVWDPQWKQFQFNIVYDAARITDKRWAALVSELPSAIPTVQGDPAVRYQVQRIQPPTNFAQQANPLAPPTPPGPQVNLSYEIIVSPNKGQNVDLTNAPPINSLSMDIPSIAEVDVPVEFHDLPLP
jgi:hypothetical protein